SPDPAHAPTEGLFSPSDPPVRDFSGADDNSADEAATSAPPSAETNDAPSTCDNDAAHLNVPQPSVTTTSQPLLTTRESLPVTELHLTPEQSGATISSTTPHQSYSPLPTPDSLPAGP